MSDAGGGGGGVDVLDIQTVISADTSAAQKAAEELGSNIVQVGRAATGSGTTGFRLFGIAATQSIDSISSRANLLNRQLGMTSPFAPMIGSLDALNGSMQVFGSRIDDDQGKLSRLQMTGMGLSALGGVIMGIGAATMQAAAPLQMAQASLATSISNTTNKLTGQADSIDNWRGKISDAVNEGSKFGFSADAINKSLAQLTEETRSAPEAFNELKFAETLAAATAESTKSSYLDLAGSTALVGRMHAGLFRSLRRFGIDIPSMLVNPQKDATKAANELAAATQHLTDAQRNLSDFEAKLQADEQKRQQQWADKVQSTSATAQQSQQTYQDQLVKVSEAEARSQQASSSAQQTISDNAQKLAQDTATSADRVATARQRIADLQQQWADQDAALADRAIKDQQATTQAIIDAQNNLNDMNQQWSETPARTAQQQLTRLDQMRKAQEQLAKAEADAAAKAQADQISPSQQLTRQTQMKAAQDALNNALEKQSQLATESAKMQLQNQKALEGAAVAAQAYALAQQRAAITQAKAAEDQRKADAAQRALSGAGQPTLAQGQQLQKLQEDVAKQQAAVAKAKKAQQDAADFQKKLDDQFNAAMSQFMARETGLLEHRSKTWAGHLANWKADLTNMVQTLGQYAPMIMTLGMGASGIGTLINVTGKIREGIGKMRTKADEAAKSAQKTGQALAGIEEAAPAADNTAQSVEQLALKFGDAEASSGQAVGGVEQLALKFGTLGEGAAGAATGVAGAGEGIGGSIAAIGPMIFSPIGLIVAAIAGIAAIGYIVYRNWSTISKLFTALWGDIERFAVRVFDDLLGFFKRWGPLILLAFAPIIGLPLLIFQHWGQIEGFFKSVGGKVLTWAGHFGHDVVTGILTGLEDLMNMGGWLMEWIWISIKKVWDWTWDRLKDMGGDIIHGLINGISGMANKLWDAISTFVVNTIENSITSGFGLFSPSRVMHNHGQNIVQGLINGIMSKHKEAGAAMNTVIGSLGVGAGLGQGLTVGRGLASSSSLAPTTTGGTTVMNLSVPLTVQGNVVTEQDLQNNLKTFLQQGAQQNGGIARFLGLVNS